MKPLLHPATASQLESVVRKPKGAYLFVGPEGTGKITAARWLAKRLHCGLAEGCKVCHMIDIGAYGDFILVEPQESGSVGIAQVKELLSQLSHSRMQSNGFRIAVIDGANRLTVEAQNSLLKTMEEPPESTMIVLAATEVSGILATIKSRCETVYFSPLTDTEISRYLSSEMGVAGDQANKIALLSLGSIGTAKHLASEADAYKRASDLLALIERVQVAPLFDRLVAASKLQEGTTDTGRFVRLLARQLRERLRLDPSAATAEAVVALERFERNLKANVNGRSAWSRLLLEL